MIPRLPLVLALLALPTAAQAVDGKERFGPACVFSAPTDAAFAPGTDARSLVRRTVERGVSAPARPRLVERGSSVGPLAGTSPAGTAKNLVIALRFADHGPAGQNRTLPDRSDLDAIWNDPGGHTVLAPTGSVRDVWLENSYGVFTFDSTVVAWLDVPGTEAYYANAASGLSTLTWDLVRDGLDAVDPLVDFTDFDQDGDGRIDTLTVLHSGYGAEFGGVDQYGTASVDRIWSHRWSIDPVWTSAEGVTVRDYSISPGLWSTSGSEPVRIGVLAHELGHILGLPDLYDIDGTSYGAGNWELMAGGAWGFPGDQRYPSHLSAWSKWKLGWLEPIEMLPNTFNIRPVETTPQAGIVRCGYGPGEYLLLENRQTIGFDLQIPIKGLAIWHVDERKGSYVGNGVNVDEGWPGMGTLPKWPENDLHYRLALLCPDDAWALEQHVDRGDAGDLWPDGGATAIDDGTKPGLFAYQRGVKIEAGNRIWNIQQVGTNVQFNLVNNQRPLITSPQTLPPATQGMPYAHQLTHTGGIGPFAWSEVVDQPSYVHGLPSTVVLAPFGTPQGWQGDDEVWTLSLPFAFPYWEGAATEVTVSSNGFVDLVPAESSDPFPDGARLFAHRRIAPLWTDLTTTTAGDDVFVSTAIPGRVTIRWQAHTFGGGMPCNFSVTLAADGGIRFDYGAGNQLDGPATVGIGRGHEADRVLVPTHDGETLLPFAPSVEFARHGSGLPAGLSIDTNGLVSGTPLTVGTALFEVEVADEIHNCDRQGIKLTVAPAQNPMQAPRPVRRP